MNQKPLLSARYYAHNFKRNIITASVLSVYGIALLIFADKLQSAGIPFLVAGVFFALTARSRSQLNKALLVEESTKQEVQEYMDNRPHVDRNFKSERSGKTIKEMTEEYENSHETEKEKPHDSPDTES